MGQVFGKANIAANGKRLRSMPGAKLDLGGMERAVVKGSTTVHGFSETVKEPGKYAVFVGGLTVPLAVPFSIDSTVSSGLVSLVNPGTIDGPVSLRLYHLDGQEARRLFDEQLARGRAARAAVAPA